MANDYLIRMILDDKEVVKGYRNIRKEDKKTRDSFLKTQKATEQATKVTTGGLLTMRGAITGLAAGFAAIGISAATRDMINIGQQANQLEREFEALTRSIGILDHNASLSQLSASLGGTVDNIDLLSASTGLLHAGLVQSQDDLEKMAFLAVNLGDKLKTPGERIEDFRQLLTQLSPERLDNFGISAGRARVEIEKLIKERKKLGEKITREDAFREVVFTLGTESVERLGDAAESAQDNFITQFTIGWRNLYTNISQDLQFWTDREWILNFTPSNITAQMEKQLNALVDSPIFQQIASTLSPDSTLGQYSQIQIDDRRIAELEKILSGAATDFINNPEPAINPALHNLNELSEYNKLTGVSDEMSEIFATFNGFKLDALTNYGGAGSGGFSPTNTDLNNLLGSVNERMIMPHTIRSERRKPTTGYDPSYLNSQIVGLGSSVSERMTARQDTSSGFDPSYFDSVSSNMQSFLNSQNQMGSHTGIEFISPEALETINAAVERTSKLSEYIQSSSNFSQETKDNFTAMLGEVESLSEEASVLAANIEKITLKDVFGLGGSSTLLKDLAAIITSIGDDNWILTDSLTDQLLNEDSEAFKNFQAQMETAFVSANKQGREDFVLNTVPKIAAGMQVAIQDGLNMEGLDISDLVALGDDGLLAGLQVNTESIQMFESSVGSVNTGLIMATGQTDSMNVGLMTSTQEATNFSAVVAELPKLDYGPGEDGLNLTSSVELLSNKAIPLIETLSMDRQMNLTINVKTIGNVPSGLEELPGITHEIDRY